MCYFVVGIDEPEPGCYLQEMIQLLLQPRYLEQFEVVLDLINYYMEIVVAVLIFGYIIVETFP